MAIPLLTTKLYIPRPRPNLVPRPRLIERVKAGLHSRLTLISAPAGFGKTTLISEWICSSERSAAWVSLDEGDNDPVQFINYLIAALQQVHEGIGQTVQHLLQSPQLPPTQSLIILLINDITATGTPLTLVLDDYHVITSASVHQIVEFLLEHQPPLMHLVIGTREDPPLPLPRLRVRGQVTEIRERDLRFTGEETAAFLRHTMRLPLSPEAVRVLESRTEGWIAGLQLAALALQEDREAAEAFIATFRGDDRYVMDYLIAEVLQRQPEAARDFLRQTAILDRLTAPLCNAVTGGENGQAILEQLEEGNLFLIPLDHRREWYRYHRLFAEVLRTTLNQEEQKLLHQRAMRWHETHGLRGQAIQHALAYASAFGDASPGSAQALDDAERLIRLGAEETIYGGGLLTVRGWLDALPDERVRADGELATYKGWVLALTGEMAPAEDYANAAERCLRRTKAPDRDLGKLLALRSWITLLAHQDCERATELAAGALQMLGEDQLHWRVIALWVMAESLERTRSITEAIEAFREARQIGLALGNQMLVGMVEMTLVQALNNHGRRREAVAVCEEAIHRYTDDTGPLSPLVGLIFSRLGQLHYEANQLELARRCHEQGRALTERLALGSSFAFFDGFVAPTLYAQGETEAALDALQRGYQSATHTGFADVDGFLAWEADIRLKEGDLPFALRWAEAADLSPDDTPQYLHIEQHLVYARLLLAQGRRSDARHWLARLERLARERGLYRWLITVHILQALAAERSGDHPATLEHLARALEMAAPQDYVRAFLDEDEEVVALLRGVRHVAPAFVDQLLDYAGVPEPRRDIAPQPLIEPLTERELEVLWLMRGPLSSREIAEELIIAPSTVRSHIKSIYSKLGVHSRRDAVRRAKELGLL